MTHPLFTDTVTLYRKNGDQYVPEVLRGVQWRQKIERLNDGGKLIMVTVTTVTVPEQISAAISPGDVMILGVGPKLSASYTIARLREDNPTYCTVRGVTDNRLRPQLRHRKVTAV